jgi:hypothetical protein
MEVLELLVKMGLVLTDLETSVLNVLNHNIVEHRAHLDTILHQLFLLLDIGKVSPRFQDHPE